MIMRSPLSELVEACQIPSFSSGSCGWWVTVGIQIECGRCVTRINAISKKWVQRTELYSVRSTISRYLTQRRS